MGISQTHCFYCGIELTQKQQLDKKLVCTKCANKHKVPEKGYNRFPRNALCHCGSGLKYKHCHYYQDKFPPMEEEEIAPETSN